MDKFWSFIKKYWRILLVVTLVIMNIDCIDKHLKIFDIIDEYWNILLSLLLLLYAVLICKCMNFFKKYWDILLFLFLVSVHIILMRVDFINFFQGNLVADWLGYFGSLIGAGVSIFGIYWTLQDNRKQLEDQHRKEIMPFLLLKETTGGVKTSEGLFLSDKVNHLGELIEGKPLDDKFSTLEVKAKKEGEAGDTSEELFYLSFRLENIGLEAGFITKIDITGLSETYSTDNVGRYKGKILVSALPKEKCYIALKLKSFVKDMFSNNDTPNKLEVIFKYEDLSQNQYKVSKAIEFRKREDKIEIYGARDSRPELV